MVKTRLKFAGASDMGRVRRNNEDAWYIDAERGIFLVVDGIGGHAAGEKAAAIAVERVRARLERQTGAAEQRVREAIALANNEILRAASENPDWKGMACVLTLALLDNGSVVVGHVGDSRLYEIRGGKIRKVTHDHSPVGEREDSGELTEAEAMRHPRRNEVFRDVGSEEHAPDDPNFIEAQRIPFDPASALVLCSDGLSDLTTSEEIRRIVEAHAGDPETAAQKLIDAANSAGGKDNITVVVVEGDQFLAPAPPKPVPVEAAPRRGWVVPAILALAAALGAAGYVIGRATAPAPLPPPRVPQVWKVGNNGAPSVSAALAQAQAGDTIEVAPGEYNEQIALKSGVAIMALPARGAILRAPGGGPAVVGASVQGARLSGFRIVADPQAPLSAGIVLTDSAVEIDDTEISGAQTGIVVRGGGRPVLRANAIRDCTAAGILIDGPAEAWLSHNSIVHNKAALAASAGSRPALIGNIFDRSPIALPAEVDMKAVHEHNFFIPEPIRRRP